MDVTTRLRLLERTRLADAADAACARAVRTAATAAADHARAFADLGHWHQQAATAGDDYLMADLMLHRAVTAHALRAEGARSAAARMARTSAAAEAAREAFARAWAPHAPEPGAQSHTSVAAGLLDELSALPLDLIRSADALVVQSSGGKDSVVLLHRVVTWAELAGCLDKVVVVHADLGPAEWPGVRELAERQALRYGVRFVVVRAPRGFLPMVEARGMWPSADARYCTSSLKRDEAAKLFTEIVQALGLDEQAVIVNCLGIRAAESAARRQQRNLAIDKRASTGRRLVLTWHAVFDLSEADIWRQIAEHTLEYHPVYDTLIPRLSCTYCVLAPFDVLVQATRLCWLWGLETPEAYLKIELKIGHRFTAKFSLDDVVDEARRREDAHGPIRWAPADAIRRHVGDAAADGYLHRLGLSRTDYLKRFGLAA